MPSSAPPDSNARISSRNVTSPSPRTMTSTPRPGCVHSSRREARIVAADDDAHAGRQRAHQRDDPPRRRPLKGHHRQADDVGLRVADEALDRRPDGGLREDEVGDRDLMVRIDVAGERAERAVRHAHRDRRRVLERVRHREQQEAHGSGIRDQGSGIRDQGSRDQGSGHSWNQGTGIRHRSSGIIIPCTAAMRPFMTARIVRSIAACVTLASTLGAPTQPLRAAAPAPPAPPAAPAHLPHPPHLPHLRT